MMTEIFNDKMTPSELLNGWLTNDYLSSFPKEKTDKEKKWWKKTLLITGGAGFLGKRLGLA